ncbi:NACHT domain-containing protein [Microbispora triticiradicis]|uniref:NACHT domain-containing protein n=1 Tax=Microbispora triticiradicis TaxID=2200763 RepID=A0A5R8YIS8_9ACTN|nr:NACHT domain-containing protein [Microbispora fusca]TLP52128.1 NACHT domain-containing protein [Microbispora fusca]
MNGRRSWWPILFAVAVVAALAVAVSVVGQVLDPDDKVNRADLVALVVAALAFAAPVVLWARRRATPAPPASEETITAAKTTLTNLVAEQWRTEATIRSLGDPEPIPVSWHLTDDPGLMDHPRLIGHQPLTFTATGDRIPRLAENFRALRRRRLVITGGPGSGKTTLAVQLLLHLADDHRPEEPVPVLFTIAGWDTTAQPRLHDWLAARLAQDYPALTNPAYGPDAARTLVGRGHILPILDGLDELPGDARASAIAALNGSLAERDQFILTSRTGELAAALDQAGDVLTAAAVIAPRPLTPQAAAGYVRTCLPPRPRHDWTPVIEALENADRPGLAEVASTALGLWLIRTVYITPSTDPAPLVGPLADDRGRLRAHLLDHLIPAAIQARPPTRAPPSTSGPATPGPWDTWLCQSATPGKNDQPHQTHREKPPCRALVRAHGLGRVRARGRARRRARVRARERRTLRMVGRRNHRPTSGPGGTCPPQPDGVPRRRPPPGAAAHGRACLPVPPRRPARPSRRPAHRSARIRAIGGVRPVRVRSCRRRRIPG